MYFIKQIMMPCGRVKDYGTINENKKRVLGLLTIAAQLLAITTKTTPTTANTE